MFTNVAQIIGQHFKKFDCIVCLSVEQEEDITVCHVELTTNNPDSWYLNYLNKEK